MSIINVGKAVDKEIMSELYVLRIEKKINKIKVFFQREIE